MQIYFHSRLCSYLPRVPILVEGTVISTRYSDMPAFHATSIYIFFQRCYILITAYGLVFDVHCKDYVFLK